MVLDALDECPANHRRHVLDLLETVTGWDLGTPLHILVASRPEGDINACLQPLASGVVVLQDVAGQRSAISDYVAYVLKHDRDFCLWRTADRALALRRLNDFADGM